VVAGVQVLTPKNLHVRDWLFHKWVMYTFAGPADYVWQSEVGTMDSIRIQETLTIAVADYKSLLVAWRMQGGPRSPVALRFILAKPLTDAQFRRLPDELIALTEFPDDSVAFLERLYALEDPRG
jgi:hypothetical protein